MKKIKLPKNFGLLQEELTPQQKKNLVNKHIPQREAEYIVTDQCFWEQNPPKDYNVLDPKRSPHAVTLVDKSNGSIVLLKSGSIIKVIHAKEDYTT